MTIRIICGFCVSGNSLPLGRKLSTLYSSSGSTILRKGLRHMIASSFLALTM